MYMRSKSFVFLIRYKQCIIRYLNNQSQQFATPTKIETKISLPTCTDSEFRRSPVEPQLSHTFARYVSSHSARVRNVGGAVNPVGALTRSRAIQRDIIQFMSALKTAPLNSSSLHYFRSKSQRSSYSFFEFAFYSCQYRGTRYFRTCLHLWNDFDKHHCEV